MKIVVDGMDLLTLTDTQKKVICNDIPTEALEEDLKRRVKYIVEHKYEQCYKRLKEEWEPKLIASGVSSIPADKDAFAELVFSQPNYKDRSAREADAKAALAGESK